MSDYIKREDAILELACNCYAGEMTLKGYDRVLAALANIPAADVREVVRGKWIWSGLLVERPHCSECMADAYWVDGYGYMTENYCPNCGADMREES